MADNHHSEHVPGTMDIRVQEKTFAGFMKMVTWGAVICLGLLVFLALANG